MGLLEIKTFGREEWPKRVLLKCVSLLTKPRVGLAVLLSKKMRVRMTGV